jgi:hypothetical protein
MTAEVCAEATDGNCRMHDAKYKHRLARNVLLALRILNFDLEP